MAFIGTFKGAPFQMVELMVSVVVAPFNGTFMLGRLCILVRVGCPNAVVPDPAVTS